MAWLLSLMLSTASIVAPFRGAPVEAPRFSAAPDQASIGLAETPVQEAALYRVVLVRAAPGRLLELIDALKAVQSDMASSGGWRPHLMRHSQGDHWDLMWLGPFDPETAMPERSAEFDPRWDALIAWREELMVRGPDVETVAAKLADASFFHIEMFVGLPGKRQELLRQREMENAYLRGIDRPENLIFWRVAGAQWDLFTLGAYRDLKHFAESADVPEDLQEQAAILAGFEAADRIGTYLRSLIARHQDTLAGVVR